MVSPEAIAAVWATWHSRHGGKIGPGPAFSEAIAAAVAVESVAIQRTGLIAGLREAAERCGAISANPTWSSEMISVYECALADAEASIRARITTMEEEGKS